MTSPAPTRLPSISITELENLNHAPGKLKIIIKLVSGYRMPFVYHTSEDGITQLHGIIVSGGQVLATAELKDILLVLKDLIGNQHEIVTSNDPDVATMH